jgi:hypothetical protein
MTDTEKTNEAPNGPSDSKAMLGCCPEWEPGVKHLNDFIITATVRAGKPLYKSKPFRFCPWCGSEKKPNARVNPGAEGDPVSGANEG